MAIRKKNIYRKTVFMTYRNKYIDTVIYRYYLGIPTMPKILEIKIMKFSNNAMNIVLYTVVFDWATMAIRN